MAQAGQDIYRGHTPAAFVSIGGKAMMVTDYNCTVTSRGEAGVATVHIPLENVKSEVFADESVLDNIFEIEIWAGYLTDTEDPKKQIDSIYKSIQAKDDKQRNFSKRFEGYVLQPEWQYGTGKMLTLSCIDWTGFLRDYKFARELSGGATEARSIIKMMNSDITGIDIKIQNYAGNVNLGESDTETNEIVYNAVGQSYWDILQDIATKLSYLILVDGKTINLVSRKDAPLLWNMYYGPRERQEIDGKSRGQFFSDLNIRFGAKGRIDKSNVVIEVVGVNVAKKAKTDEAKKGKAVRVIYGVTETKNGRRGNPKVLNPSEAPITTNTKYERIVVSGNCTEQQAQVIAETRYRELATRLITGTLQLEFANPFIGLQDLIAFVPDESEKDMEHLKGVFFSVNSVSDEFGMSGFSQTIEFDSDPTIENAAQIKIVPKPKDKK